MKKIKMISVVSLVLIISVATKGCALLENDLGNLKSAMKGREAFIQTYDEESNIIDKIEGTSIDVSRESKFDTEKSDSSVLNVTVGGSEMVHVGSSLIMYEKGLENQFETFAKTVDVKNFDRSTPFLNKMVNSWDNITTGRSKVVLIRSQSGKPLATFAGDEVSYFATGVDKSTGIMIDGKYLFIYRCDYSIYDTELLR
jgi:hypothetical protein